MGLAALPPRLPDAEVEAVLVDALDHESTTVRTAAAGALVEHGQQSAFLPLLTTLGDRNARCAGKADRGGDP
jgi:HEAT repeat protein